MHYFIQANNSNQNQLKLNLNLVKPTPSLLTITDPAQTESQLGKSNPQLVYNFRSCSDPEVDRDSQDIQLEFQEVSDEESDLADDILEKHCFFNNSQDTISLI